MMTTSTLSHPQILLAPSMVADQKCIDTFRANLMLSKKATLPTTAVSARDDAPLSRQRLEWWNAVIDVVANYSKDHPFTFSDACSLLAIPPSDATFKTLFCEAAGIATDGGEESKDGDDGAKSIKTQAITGQALADILRRQYPARSEHVDEVLQSVLEFNPCALIDSILLASGRLPSSKPGLLLNIPPKLMEWIVRLRPGVQRATPSEIRGFRPAPPLSLLPSMPVR
jgi:hypothetical protein